MVEVTIGILTFLRDHMLYKCVENLQRNVEVPFDLHIVDQGRSTPDKSKFYGDLREKGYRITEFPFDVGAGQCMTFLFGECKTPHQLWIHDDSFPRRGSVQTLLQLMKDLSVKEVRVVAPVHWERGRYRYLTKNFAVKNGVVSTKAICKNTRRFDGVEFERSRRGIRYILSNLPTSIALYDMAIFQKINWDRDMIACAGGHIDLFLQFAKTNWKAVTTPDAIFDHIPDRGGEYGKYRRNASRRRKEMAHFEKKWNIRLR